MHNIDRTVGEANYEYNQEGGYELNPESYEITGEYGQEFEDEFLQELQETGELPGEYGQETSHESYEMNEISQEAFETELATELLSVSNEAEMEQFLGKLVRRAAGAVKSFAKSSAGRAIGGFLKSAAKKALPFAGRALGTFVGGPLGGAIGGKLGSLAGNLFELELEGLSNEDKEFEMARAYVRFANHAVRTASRNPAFRSRPRSTVRSAVISSARRYAPGLLRRIPRPRPYPSNGGGYNYGGAWNGSAQQDQSSGTSSGTWYRQGNQIILNLQ
ncbi:hypothetical protein ACX0G7_20035 [Flavitalea antarctica]